LVEFLPPPERDDVKQTMSELNSQSQGVCNEGFLIKLLTFFFPENVHKFWMQI
jgi:hypothetical protein